MSGNQLPATPVAGLLGCDVSKFQLEVDFPKLVEVGIAFGYIREGESNWREGDDRWAINWPAAHAAGLPCGPYHPPHGGSSGRDQARILRDRCRDWEHGRDLRPAIDLEVKGTPVEVAEEMAEEILALFGVLPVVYTGKWFARAIGLGRSSILAQCPLWLAAYVSPPPALPDAWDDWTIWQFSGSGRLPGITTDVDLNVIRSAAALDMLRDVSRVGPPETMRSPGADPAPMATAAQDAWRDVT